jgi:hypothetical protein
MTKMLLRCVFLAALAAAVSSPAVAGELKLTMQNGRVTVIADNVPVRQILQEWARVGQTRIVNVEKVSGQNLTVQLVNMPERDALDVILRSASGYIAAPRTTPLAGAADYDRITIFMATSKAPAQVASAAPPTFQRPPQPEVDDEPINVQMPAQMNPANGQFPQPNGQFPGVPPQLPPQLQQQLQQGPAMSPVPGPMTSPRPGALPTPAMPNGLPNPYQPIPLKPGGGPGGGPGGPGGPGGGPGSPDAR